MHPPQTPSPSWGWATKRTLALRPDRENVVWDFAIWCISRSRNCSTWCALDIIDLLLAWHIWFAVHLTVSICCALDLFHLLCAWPAGFDVPWFLCAIDLFDLLCSWPDGFALCLICFNTCGLQLFNFLCAWAYWFAVSLCLLMCSLFELFVHGCCGIASSLKLPG